MSASTPTPSAPKVKPLTVAQHRVLDLLGQGHKAHFMPHGRSSNAYTFIDGPGHLNATREVEALLERGFIQRVRKSEWDQGHGVISEAGRAHLAAHPYETIKPPRLHWWEVSFGSIQIDQVTLSKATTDFVWIEGGRRTARSSHYGSYYPTLGEARTALIQHHEHALRSAEAAVTYQRSQCEKAKQAAAAVVDPAAPPPSQEDLARAQIVAQYGKTLEVL